MSVALLSRILRLMIVLTVMPVALIGVAACKPCPSMITGSADLRQDDSGGFGPLAKGGPKKGGKNEGNGGVNGRGSGSGNTAAKNCSGPGKGSGKKSDGKKDRSMFGANGVQTHPDKPLLKQREWKRYTYRIDMENPSPGVRPGNIHVQLGGKVSDHYYWRPGGHFSTKEGKSLPRKLQDHLNEDADAQQAIRDGLRFLGES
jgi:hypothetical protein